MANEHHPLLTGTITFIQNHIPALEAGEYKVRIDQQVENTNPGASADEQFNENYWNEKHFAVTAERFKLNPAEIYNIFPPDKNQGEYDNVLPHIVLTAPGLPWVRTPDGTDQGKPWMALLLFEQDELDAQAKAERPIKLSKPIMVGDLQDKPFPHTADGQPAPSNLPSDTISYPGLDASKPADPVGPNGLDYGENWWDVCQAIDVPIDLFNEIAPSLKSAVGPDGKGDLQLLAHARSVTSNARQSASVKPVDADYSVVVCNRLPTPNTTCSVHLVSLENLGTIDAPYLPSVDASGNYQPGTFPAGKDYLRLVSLKNWSFTSVDPKETFTAFLENLSTGSLENIPATDAGIDISGPLSLGYTPINHHSRLGDKTVSWYRGPLVPMSTPALFEPLPDPNATPVVDPLTSADQAMRYNPDTGMMDVSYAAAWQLGRLLGLQNKRFSTALYNWKRNNTAKTILSVERGILQESYADILKDAQAGDSFDMKRVASALLSGPLKDHLQSGEKS